jgi:putative ABC transport system permease protein
MVKADAIKDYFILAIRNLNERRARSVLTIIGIILAIMTIFVLASLSLGLSEVVDAQFEELGGDKFFIQPRGQLGAPGTGGTVELTIADAEEVAKVPGIKVMTYYPVGNAKVEFDETIRYVNAFGGPLEDDEQIELLFSLGIPDPIEGRLLKKGDVGKVMVGYRYNKEEFFGKSVKVGNTLLVNEKEFEVVGIIGEIGSPPDDSLVYMGFDEFKDLFESGDRVDAIILQVDEGEDINKIAERAKKKLMNFRNVEEENIDFSVLTPEEVLATFGNILNILTAFLVGIGLISILVGGIGIANTMYTSVLERKKEIGIMKSIGARNSDILIIFIIEAGILGLLGGTIGLVLGIGVAKTIEFVAALSGFGFFKISLNPILIFGSLLFAFIVGVGSGLLPSLNASKLKPVDALRYE